MKRPLSIRARLLVLIVGATAVLWLLAVWTSYGDARRELNALFDGQLAESARVLLAQATEAHGSAPDLSRAGSVPTRHGEAVEHPYAQELHAQIFDAAGRLVYQSSADLPSQPLITGMTSGFADRTLHGVRWRVAVLTDEASGLQIQLCQTHASREGVAAAIARSMLVPLVVALPLLGALIWAGTAGGIRPLARLAAQLETRASRDLAPLAPGRLPRELEPVVRSLDALFARLRERFDLERRFTADAAHELRTPLAAVRVQAQVAEEARDGDARAHALGQIVRSVDRATHTAEQLLTLARLDPDIEAAAAARVDLGAAVRETVAELVPAAVAKGVRLEVDGEAAVAGDATLLATLVRNLVENAIRHGGAGGEVALRIEPGDHMVTLLVEDRGPGMAPAARARAFDRFFRGDAPDEGGSGLGLSIVKRIAEAHGGSVELSDRPDGPGLRVAVRFPAYPA